MVFTADLMLLKVLSNITEEKFLFLICSDFRSIKLIKITSVVNLRKKC
jgi:hypothetical protein